MISGQQTESIRIPIRMLNQEPDTWGLAADIGTIRIRGIGDSPTEIHLDVYDASEPEQRKIGSTALSWVNGKWAGIERVQRILAKYDLSDSGICIYNHDSV